MAYPLEREASGARHDVPVAELARVVRESERHADAGRRNWPYTLQVSVALLLFALAPMAEGAEHLFGALTVRESLTLILPGAMVTVFTVFVYQRFGSDHSVYRAFEVLESFLLYFINVGIVFATQLSWPVLWILCPFTTVYWATTKPYETRLHTTIVVVAHALLALAYVVRGDVERVWIAGAMAMLSFAPYLALVRLGKRNVVFEAQRNVAEAKLNAAHLDATRRRLALTLRDGIGREIEALARELDAPEVAEIAEQAIATRASLAAVVAVVAEEARTASSAVALIRRIDEKCAPLCDGVGWACALAPGSVVDAIGADDAHALLRLAQELVRNAIVHGRARSVRVELFATSSALTMRVADDGVGLTHERFAQATGGLGGAARSFRARAGSLELLDVHAGTMLEATLPRDPP